MIRSTNGTNDRPFLERGSHKWNIPPEYPTTIKRKGVSFMSYICGCLSFPLGRKLCPRPTSRATQNRVWIRRVGKGRSGHSVLLLDGRSPPFARTRTNLGSGDERDDGCEDPFYLTYYHRCKRTSAPIRFWVPFDPGHVRRDSRTPVLQDPEGPGDPSPCVTSHGLGRGRNGRSPPE